MRSLIVVCFSGLLRWGFKGAEDIQSRAYLTQFETVSQLDRLRAKIEGQSNLIIYWLIFFRNILSANKWQIIILPLLSQAIIMMRLKTIDLRPNQ